MYSSSLPPPDAQLCLQPMWREAAAAGSNSHFPTLAPALCRGRAEPGRAAGSRPLPFPPCRAPSSALHPILRSPRAQCGKYEFPLSFSRSLSELVFLRLPPPRPPQPLPPGDTEPPPRRHVRGRGIPAAGRRRRHSDLPRCHPSPPAPRSFIPPRSPIHAHPAPHSFIRPRRPFSAGCFIQRRGEGSMGSLLVLCSA